MALTHYNCGSYNIILEHVHGMHNTANNLKLACNVQCAKGFVQSCFIIYTVYRDVIFVVIYMFINIMGTCLHIYTIDSNSEWYPYII